jgi:hypothetical protein
MLTTLLTSYFVYKTVTGKGSITSVIQSMNCVYNTAKKILSNEELTFLKCTYDIDIEYKIKSKEKFLKDLTKFVSDEDLIDHEAIMYTIKSINDILNDISIDVSQLEIKITRHKLKWFNKIRDIKCKKEVHMLKIHLNMLDVRYNDLIQLLKLRCLSNNKGIPELVNIFNSVKNKSTN